MAFYSNCGAQIGEGATYCSKCGVKIEKNSKMMIAKRLFSKGTWAGWAFIAVAVLHLLFYLGSNDGFFLITFGVTVVGAITLIAIGAKSEKEEEEE